VGAAAEPVLTERYYLPAEIKTRLRVSIRTVYSWIEQGIIPSVRIGGAVRIPAEDFDAMLAARRRGRTTQGGQR
jgi:excisionase family DNA binding protein